MNPGLLVAFFTTIGLIFWPTERKIKYLQTHTTIQQLPRKSRGLTGSFEHREIRQSDDGSVQTLTVFGGAGSRLSLF